MTKRNKHLIYLVAAGGLAWLLTRPKGQPRSSKEAVTPTLGRASAAVPLVSIWTDAGVLKTPYEIQSGKSMSPEASRFLTDTAYRVDTIKQYQAASKLMKVDMMTGKPEPGYGRGLQIVRPIRQMLKEAGMYSSDLRTFLSGERQPVIVRREI